MPRMSDEEFAAAPLRKQAWECIKLEVAGALLGVVLWAFDMTTPPVEKK